MWLFRPNIEKMKQKQNYEKLGKCLNSRNFLTKKEALSALEELGTDQAVEKLCPALKDEYPINNDALTAIQRIGGSTAVNCLKIHISGNKNVIPRAFEVLGELAGKECVDFLKDQVKTGNWNSLAWEVLLKLDSHEAVMIWCEQVLQVSRAKHILDCVIDLHQRGLSDNDLQKILSLLGKLGTNSKYRSLRQNIRYLLEYFENEGVDTSNYISELQKSARGNMTDEELLIARTKNILEKIVSEYKKQKGIQTTPVQFVLVRCYENPETADDRYAQMIAYAEKYPKGAPRWISRSKSKSISDDLVYPHWVGVPYKEVDKWMENCQEKFNQLYWSTSEDDYGIPDYNSYLQRSEILHTWTKDVKI